MTCETDYIYEIQLSVDLLEAAPGVTAALEPLQDILTKCGLGKLGIRARLLSCTITSSRVLTKQERAIVKEKLLESLNERFPRYQWAVESMRRKSRKSRSQSASK